MNPQVQEAAWLLGFQIHEIHFLTRSGQLKPLGKPRRGPKRFASVYIQTLAADSNWLVLSTDIIARHWTEKNVHSKEAEA